MRATARTFLVAALALGLALPSIGYANTKAGEALVKQGTIGGAPCMQCHGANGEGQAAAGYPRLAGQSKAYLMKQLQDFKSGQRHDPLMNVFAQALKEQQISDVAEYYASLPGWQPSKQAWSTLPPHPHHRPHWVWHWYNKVIGIRGSQPVSPVMAKKGPVFSLSFRHWPDNIKPTCLNN